MDKIEFPFKNQTSKNIINDFNIMSSILDANSDKDLYAFSLFELDTLLYIFELNALSTRSAIQEKFEHDTSEFIRESKYIKDNKLSSELFKKNIPVEINYEKNRMLEVFTPLTIKRGYEYKYSKENFTLCDYVHIRFEEWVQSNPDIDLTKDLTKPYTVFVIRRVNQVTRKVCDPDNLETGRIINEIFANRLLQSDNAANVRIINDCEVVKTKEECGTLFRIVPSRLISININNV